MDLLKLLKGIFKSRKVHKEMTLLNGIVTDHKEGLSFYKQTKAAVFMIEELAVSGIVDLEKKQLSGNTVTFDIEDMNVFKDIKKANNLTLQLESIIYDQTTHKIVHEVYIALGDVKFVENNKIECNIDNAKTMILSREMVKPAKSNFLVLKFPSLTK